MNDQWTVGSDPGALDELLGAYALDALDGAERDRVMAYVESDPVARREVDELRETAAMLALAPFDHEPAPAELLDRIMDTIAFDDDVSNAPVDLAKERARRRGLPWGVAFASAAVAAALIGVLAVRAANPPNDDLADRFASARANGTVVELDGSAPVTAALDDGRGVLALRDLPDLGDGEVYQGWAVYPGGGAPVSIGVFGNDTDYAEFRYAPDLAALAITVESGGGVVQSTNEPVVSGSVE